MFKFATNAMSVAILLVLLSTSLASQSLTVFDIDASSYPAMRAKFYAIDADGNQMSGLSPGDLQLREDGVARSITRVSCPAVSPPRAISSVLTIDISGSMSGMRMQAACTALAMFLRRENWLFVDFNYLRNNKLWRILCTDHRSNTELARSA